MLKTLEEPPKNVIFILATTEPHKIPLTILSRCQRYDFKRLNNVDIVDRLKFIVNKEQISVEDGVLEMIADISNGGMRDSIGLLDQLTTYCDGEISLEAVHEVNGSINSEQIFMFVKEIVNKKYNSVCLLLNQFNNDGKNLSNILESVINFFKNTLIYFNCPNYFERKMDIEMYEHMFNLTNEAELYVYIDVLLDTLKNIKLENNKKMLIELSFIKIFNLLNNKCKNTISNDMYSDGINFLDDKIKKIKIENSKNIRLSDINNNINKIKKN